MIPLVLLLLAQASANAPGKITGEWVNEHRTAVIRIADCQTSLCGTIIWSAAPAQRDAARGGTYDLKGTVVMLDFVPTAPQRWRGKLFLPDHARTVKATIELQSNGTLSVRGCELGGLVCRSQMWTRWAAN